MKFAKGYVVNYIELVTEFYEKFRVYPDQTILYWDSGTELWLSVEGVYTGEQIELIYQEAASCRVRHYTDHPEWA